MFFYSYREPLLSDSEYSLLADRITGLLSFVLPVLLGGFILLCFLRGVFGMFRFFIDRAHDGDLAELAADPAEPRLPRPCRFHRERVDGCAECVGRMDAAGGEVQ